MMTRIARYPIVLMFGAKEKLSRAFGTFLLAATRAFSLSLSLSLL